MSVRKIFSIALLTLSSLAFPAKANDLELSDKIQNAIAAGNLSTAKELLLEFSNPMLRDISLPFVLAATLEQKDLNSGIELVGLYSNPITQDIAASTVIAALLEAKKCDDAKLMVEEYSSDNSKKIWAGSIDYTCS